jgi:molybdopterin converting factor small subunit
LNEQAQSRRHFVRLALYSLIGTLAFFEMGDLTLVLAQKIERSASTSLDKMNDALIGVKVVYLLMAQYIETGEEYFTLPSPATVSNLLGDVLGKHPALSEMMTSMQILINGSPAINLRANLKDGDEVDFLPVVAGG